MLPFGILFKLLPEFKAGGWWQTTGYTHVRIIFNTPMDPDIVPDRYSMDVRWDGVPRLEYGHTWVGSKTCDFWFQPEVAINTLTIEFTSGGVGCTSLAGDRVENSGPFDINFPAPPIE